MTGLFGEIKEEKKRVQSKRNLEPEIIDFLKTTKKERATYVEMGKALKIRSTSPALRHCVTIMANREQLRYDSFTMEWILVMKIRLEDK